MVAFCDKFYLITILQNEDNGSKLRMLVFGFVSRFHVLKIYEYRA